MGVPKFFRYISERYPRLSETIKEYQIPEFDCLYLDMNGIIHTCSHPNDNDVQFRISEDTILKNIFHYIEILFNMIQPQKLFFLAVDGVAPRAKINQQRGRRFRSAKEIEVQEAKAKAKGISIPVEKRFDSNCITPGTVFMAKLNEQLNHFIINKISTDDNWKKCKVLFSGSEVPGEGEHKIMDFIRYMKASKDYDSNTRHCLYGLDADLIMLGLCSHEPNFSLLREEVKFGKKQEKIQTPEETKFCLLHLSLLRDYLEHEFALVKNKISFPFDIEKIIDDWVLMGFLVGNDFIPHLPNLHIANNALPILYRAYMDILPTLEGYINEAGTLNLDRFEKFMEKLSRLDVEQFNEHYADFKYFESKTGRRPNESERHFYKKSEDGETASPKKTQNRDLEALIRSTAAMSLEHSDDDDDLDDESDSDIYNMEFVQHKRDYYMNKLEYENVDANFLRLQAEGYVRAIQWNLHYYYNGCCSWSWYYPHHYAPYISDIKDFKDLKLEFELGEPFLPFQQLLAVLPAYSKDLLPAAFQSLLLEASSPIIDYYPQDFKTDLNGKRQEWEAVVLIPFIDEKLLLAAMQPHLSKLTAEEQVRNEHGVMRLYSHSNEYKCIYHATKYFPDIISHAKVSLISREDIFVPHHQLVRGLSPGFDLNMYYSGFPLLRHMRHTASLEKAKVKVFQQSSVGENMILHITAEQTPHVKILASQLLGKNVYVDWPCLKEALVVSVADHEVRFTLIDPLVGYSETNVNEEEMKGPKTTEWNFQVKHIRATQMSRFGIDIGNTDVLLYVRPFAGNKYIFNVQGKLTYEKQWSKLPVAYAYQTIVKDISVYYKQLPVYNSIHDIFTPGTICFMLGHPYYGAMGEVIQNKTDDPKSHRIKISIKTTKEPALDTIKQAHAQQKTRYMYGSIAAQRLGISSHLLSRITGTIYVVLASNEPLEVTKHNIGLNLKFNKKNEEVPGYTRKDNSQWLYSTKAVELIRNYMTKCPNLFERLAINVTNDVFQEEELFDKGSNDLHNILTWLKTELHGIESRTCGAEAIDMEIVQQIEQEIEKYLKTQGAIVKTVFMQVKPHLLYKPGLNSRNVIPDPNSQNYLLDRIRCVKNSFTVPIGARGTIIGIHKGNTPAENMYDVLFDQPFAGGLSLNGCSELRGYRLAITDFVNISFGEKLEHGNSANEPTENWRHTNTASPKRNINQSPQMRLAKKGLEKLSQDIYMSQRAAQESGLKATPNTVSPQKPHRTPSNQSSEFQALWNELHKKKSKEPSPSEKMVSCPVMTKTKPVNNHNLPMSSQPQDPSAFLKAMLKIPDGNTQASKPQSKQCTPQSVAMTQRTAMTETDQTTDPPPLVQQLFDRARRNEGKQEKTSSIWYCSQLLKYFSYNRLGMPKYNYFVDDKTGLISCHIMLYDSKVFKGDFCATHEQAAENAAKMVYKVLNLDKVLTPDTKMVPAPRQQWYNNQINSSWVQNIRPPMPMPMCPSKMSPIPNPTMQPNLFYPKWNQKLPPNPDFVQIASYNQGRQQQEKSPGQSKMEIKKSTAFVPLQAQKKSRNATAKQTQKEASQNVKKVPNLKTQQQQKNQETSPKKEKPEVVNKAKDKLNEPQLSSQSQKNVQTMGKTSKPRRSRVAAKFGASPLSNGSEPQ